MIRTAVKKKDAKNPAADLISYAPVAEEVVEETVVEVAEETPVEEPATEE